MSTSDKLLQLLLIWKKNLYFALFLKNIFLDTEVGCLRSPSQLSTDVFHCLQRSSAVRRSLASLLSPHPHRCLHLRPLAPLFGFLCVCPDLALMAFFFLFLRSEFLSFLKNFDHYLLKYISDTFPLLVIPNLHRLLEIFYRSGIFYRSLRL